MVKCAIRGEAGLFSSCPDSKGFSFFPVLQGMSSTWKCLLDLSISSTCTSLAFSVALISAVPWHGVVYWQPEQTFDFLFVTCLPTPVHSHGFCISLATLSNWTWAIGLGCKPNGFGRVPGASFHSNDNSASRGFGYWPDCGRGVGYRCAAYISTGFSFMVMAVLFLTTSKDSWMLYSTPALIDD